VKYLGHFAARLEKLEKKVSNPLAFYEAHKEEWLSLAREFSDEYLMNARPAGIEPDQWEGTIRDALSRISATLISAPALTGLTICLSDLATEEGAPGENPFNLMLQNDNLTVEQIRRWVAAGRTKTSPDDPGKNIDPIEDAGLSDTQIAYKVMKAIGGMHENWERLVGHIKEFLMFEGEVALQGVADGLLEGWCAVFLIHAGRDWREWIHRQVQQF
jgi:hypothetical protein